MKNRLNRHDYKQRVINDKTVDDYNIFNSYGEDKESFEEDLTYLQDLLRIGKSKSKIACACACTQHLLPPAGGRMGVGEMVTAEGISGW